MSDQSEVFDIIKSVITSQKGGVLLKDINRDYRNLAGEFIPYKSLGYHSIEDVLDSIPEVDSFINGDGDVVFINKGKNCEHLVKLISKQKVSKNKIKLPNKKVRQKQEARVYSEFGEIVKERNKHYQEKDNNRMWMVNRSLGDKSEWQEKKSANSVEKVHNISFKQRKGAHSREGDAHFYTDFSGRKDREWEPCGGHFDELAGDEHGQDSYDSPLECRTYLFKSSNFLNREISRGVHGHNPRESGGLRKFENTTTYYEGRDTVTNWCSPMFNRTRNDKLATLSRLNSFRAARNYFLEDYPHSLYRDEGFDIPVQRNPYKSSRNPIFRSHGSSGYVPEDDDWDVNANASHKYVGRSEIDRRFWMEENYACGHSGRKIDVIGGSLRVTIKNC